MTRLGTLATLLALLLLAPTAGAQEPLSLTDIEDEVMCPICGTALNLAEAPQADRQRAFIRELIAEGRTKEEIKDRLVAEYGEEVLALPSTEGFDLAAWIVPGAAILAAAGMLGVGVRRWRRQADEVPASTGSAGSSAAESQRLDEELRRYGV